MNSAPDDPLERLKQADPARNLVGAHQSSRQPRQTRTLESLIAVITALVLVSLAAVAALVAGQVSTAAQNSNAGSADTDAAKSDRKPQREQPNSAPAASTGGATSKEGTQPGSTDNGNAGSVHMRDAASYPYWGWGGTVILEATPRLPNVANERNGWRANSRNLKQAAGELATAFGVKATPQVQDDGSVFLGNSDGSGPQLWISNDSLGSWSYFRPGQPALACSSPGYPGAQDARSTDTDASTSRGGSATGNGESLAGSQTDSAAEKPELAPMPEPHCEPETPPLEESKARGLAQKLAQKLQPAAADSELVWEVYSDNYSTTVTGTHRVEDQPTALTWTFTYNSEGLINANGFSAIIEKAGTYPTLGAADAIERSHDVRYSVFGPAHSPTSEYPTAVSSATAARTPEAASQNGEAERKETRSSEPGRGPQVETYWAPQLVTSVTESLAVHYQPDGTILLLPAYELRTETNQTWTLVSVADSAITWITQ